MSTDSKKDILSIKVIATIQELKKQNDELQKENEQLKNKLNDLKNSTVENKKMEYEELIEELNEQKK